MDRFELEISLLIRFLKNQSCYCHFIEELQNSYYDVTFGKTATPNISDLVNIVRTECCITDILVYLFFYEDDEDLLYGEKFWLDIHDKWLLFLDKH